MTGYLEEYFPLIVFFGLSLAFGLILMLAPLVAAISNPDQEKNSAYECGFEPFETARLKFDVRFYLVAILFVIFDLEVAFLFPDLMIVAGTLTNKNGSCIKKGL